MRRTATILSLLGGPRLRTVLVAAIGIELLRRGLWRGAAVLAATVGGAAIWSTLVKHLVDRRRPHHFPLFNPQRDSFPSGHASGTLTLSGSLTYIAWERSGNRSLLLTGAALSTFLTALVGLARIRLGRHHPGDVLAGYALGGLWLAAVVAAARRLKPAHR
jgi:undecaprenyl-diphosphatase